MATIDIPGAYLHTDSDGEVVMILKGRLIEILANTEPNIYRKFFLLEKGVKALYAKL